MKPSHGCVLGEGGCHAVDGLVVVIPGHTVLTPHVGLPHGCYIRKNYIYWHSITPRPLELIFRIIKSSFNHQIWDVKAVTADHKKGLDQISEL